MKPFKDSSNKLGPLGFQLANRYRAPLIDGTFRLGYTHIDKSCTIPDPTSLFYAIKVTTNKLKKCPYTKLKSELCSPHSCTVSPGCSLIDRN
jgi:hypothetical protein